MVADRPPVLVNVDDNEASLYVRGRLLRKAGFDVHDAMTGADALRKVAEATPDLVLLDVHLPDMSGLDVCRRLKETQETASIIVIQISASAITAPQASQALNQGADSYLVEPVDPDVLVATVRAMLRLRQAERDAACSNQALRDANLRLNEVNSALQRLNEDLQMFASVASHDLQEPLRTVRTHLQALERSLGGRLTDIEHRHMKFVGDAAERMSSLVADILAYSRLGREQPHQPVNLKESVEWALENLQEGLRASSCRIAVGHLPMVWGDGLQLAQVFQNLIGNSIKYRRADRDLEMSIGSEAPAPGYATIYVSDNGQGIDPKYHERIFQTFQRLHGPEVPGTGLGLSMCRRIIENHGGSIWVSSEPGRGSTFHIRLRTATLAAAGPL